MIKRSRCPAEDQVSLGRFPAERYIFNYKIFACLPSLELGGSLEIEAKHGQSPVVIVVFDPRYE